MEIPRLKLLMVRLTLFLLDIGVRTQVESGTIQIIIIPRKQLAILNIILDMLEPLMMITPLVEEA